MEDSTTNPTSNDQKNVSLCEIKIKRTLIISPNQDALLEHEERTRAQTPTMVEKSISARSSRSISPSEELPVGLPPPPRHPRWVKTPRSTPSPKGSLLGSQEDTEMQARETQETLASASILVSPTSSSASNPYINPAPTLAEFLLPKASLKTNASGHEPPSIHRSDSHDGSPIVTTSPWSPVDSSGDCSGQRPSPSHVAKLLRVNLSPYDNRNVNSPISNPEDRRRQSRPTQAVSSDRLQVHDKGKFEDMKYADSQTQGAGDNGLIDPDGKPWRRPSTSLARRPSTSPSSTNTFSFSSHEPITTTENEPRISISKTVYPLSHHHSHSHSLYNDSVLSLTKNKQNRDSHMETYSLSNIELNLDNISTKCPQLSPLKFSKISLSEDSLLPISPDASPRSSKPPLPTTPKPVFYRTSKKPESSGEAFPVLTELPKTSRASLPPTTNFLDAKERADLVRKTRKLARVFGQVPGAATAHQENSAPDTSLSVTSSDLNDSHSRRPGSALQLETALLTSGRRHSMPLSPDDMPFMTNVSPRFVRHLSLSSYQAAQVQIRSELPTSFINLSSADSLDGGDITVVMPEEDNITTRSLPSSPTQSQFEKLFEEQADEDRRRKRERLAKLHRFLGSRVPAHLVLGIDNVEASLPPLHRNPSADSRKTLVKRRRSSSAELPHSYLVNDLERVREELNEKEKFINVRRAVKMEKVFGVAPPQILYHTRQGPPPLLLSSRSASSEVRTIPSPTTSASTLQSNPNRSAYLRYKSKKSYRSSTSDSNLPLLPKDDQTFDGLSDASGTRPSTIYNHYQYSLNSLHDILDRDDRESLLELHQYLNAVERPLEASPTGRKSDASSIKSGRRRSLPTSASMISLDSEYSVTPSEANFATFQMRRRRAAKLTQFFGVDYRELINDILQSIESGVEHDHENGTLRAEEVEELFNRLRSLKAKRQNFL
ncbi:hypothetical protein BYT27DRAFT_7190062 [Phlegmacium glaucopus]|nr:hypothetical protein BYT27DRAFT_7190062 [Phlegmacium glaucopus]